MADRLPLSTLLSQVLIAYAIEADSGFESVMPHRTSMGTGEGRGLWLTSFAMWANFLRLVDAEGTPLSDLAGAAALTNLAGLQRWHYIDVAGPRGEEIVTLRKGGAATNRVWPKVVAGMERRWETRYGAHLAVLRDAVADLLGQLAVAFPAYLPVVHPGNGMFTALPEPDDRSVVDRRDLEPAPTVVLLAQLLLALTVEIEADQELSLPLAANVVRVLATAPTATRDLSTLTGTSREAVTMSLGWLERNFLISVTRHPDLARAKLAALAGPGEAAWADHVDQVTRVEKRWRAAYGAGRMQAVRSALVQMVGDGGFAVSPLRAAVNPAFGWRSQVAVREVLPHHPMVLHRGGYPDGA